MNLYHFNVGFTVIDYCWVGLYLRSVTPAHKPTSISYHYVIRDNQESERTAMSGRRRVPTIQRRYVILCQDIMFVYLSISLVGVVTKKCWGNMAQTPPPMIPIFGLVQYMEKYE